MQDAHPGISVIIRNRNGARYLRLVLEALKHQQVQPQEIILVDNESTDESVTLAQHAGARIVTISQADFTYGKASNYGMQVAKGAYCVFLSVHTLPLGPYFLHEAVSPFQDPEVAATRCIDVRHASDLKQWSNPQLLRHPVDASEVFKRGPVATACAIRKAAWEQLPFREKLEGNEDKVWASEVLRLGYSIYSPCPAFYYYMRNMPIKQAAQKHHRSDLAYFRLTNKSRYHPRKVLTATLNAVLRKAPKAAVREIAKAIMRNYYRLRLPFDEKREPDEGSIY